MTGFCDARCSGLGRDDKRRAPPFVPKHLAKPTLVSATAAFVGLFAHLSAHAQSSNVYGEDGNWQFETTADTANKSLVLQIREVKKAKAFSSNNQYDITYDINGDYINCTISSNVTGNQALIDQFAPIGSPTLTSTPTFSASSIGNTSDTAIDTNSALPGTEGLNSISDPQQIGGVSDSTTSLFGSDQVVSDSSLSSSVSGISSDFNVGWADGNGGNGSVALNSMQSNDGANLTASIADSMACAFSETTGTGAANVSQ